MLMESPIQHAVSSFWRYGVVLFVVVWLNGTGATRKATRSAAEKHTNRGGGEGELDPCRSWCWTDNLQAESDEPVSDRQHGRVAVTTT
jgi:hypothetical protein